MKTAISTFESFADDLFSLFESARTDKFKLIDLLNLFEQEGEKDPLGIEPDNPWCAEFVASDEWTNEVHERFWKLWDGDFERLQDTVLDAYETYNEEVA
ncbi:hypothetical protein ACT91Q_01485 [Brevibacillus thermoruber]|uniref:hypothetical protein n=1 Tax=Brevibacillus thermoruber TaxID=33942 RepID=UPI0040411CCE